MVQNSVSYVKTDFAIWIESWNSIVGDGEFWFLPILASLVHSWSV